MIDFWFGCEYYLQQLYEPRDGYVARLQNILRSYDQVVYMPQFWYIEWHESPYFV